MKNHFDEKQVSIPGKKRRKLCIELANRIMDRADRIPIPKDGNCPERKQCVVALLTDKTEQFIDLYFDAWTSASQVLERLNDCLPRVLSGKRVQLGFVGKDGRSRMRDIEMETTK